MVLEAQKLGLGNKSGGLGTKSGGLGTACESVYQGQGKIEEWQERC